jgi:pimeloyl-ACP methyl ester carboxylesterase
MTHLIKYISIFILLVMPAFVAAQDRTGTDTGETRLLLQPTVIAGQLAFYDRGPGLAQAALQRGEMPRLEWADCPFDTTGGLDEERIRCGYLTVLEDRNRPEGRTIRLAFAVVEAKQPAGNRDAILFLPGGPGQRALGPGLLGPAGELIATDRDFVVADFRGTGYSEPVMCPDLARRAHAIRALDLTVEDAWRMKREIVLACRDTLVEAGIAPGSYNATETAADIEDLRRMLEYDRWNLFGSSYGTLIAQAVMRDYPAGVRSAVMHSPVPIGVDSDALRVHNFARALGTLFDACTEDAVCRESFPDLETTFYETFEVLLESPLTVPVDSSRFSTPVFTVNADNFVELVYMMLRTDVMLPYLPAFIQAFAERETNAVRALVEREYDAGGGRITVWVYYASTCYDRYSPGSKAARAEAAAEHPAALRTLIYRQGVVCDDFHGCRAGEGERRRIESEIPVLIQSGQFDPGTPPTLGDEILQGLPNGYHVVFPNSSHLVSRERRFCEIGLMQQFWDRPNKRPEHPCVAETTAFSFAAELPDWAQGRDRE